MLFFEIRNHMRWRTAFASPVYINDIEALLKNAIAYFSKWQLSFGSCNKWRHILSSYGVYINIKKKKTDILENRPHIKGVIIFTSVQKNISTWNRFITGYSYVAYTLLCFTDQRFYQSAEQSGQAQIEATSAGVLWTNFLSFKGRTGTEDIRTFLKTAVNRPMFRMIFRKTSAGYE